MKFWQVDAFANKLFEGNPAAVFLCETPLGEQLMQQIANEMNLSETAFVFLGPTLSIRWFTPTKEVNLCGHATLAAAHILWQEGSSSSTLSFESKSGLLTAIRCSSGEGYTLDFPLQPAQELPERKTALQQMIGCELLYAGSNGEDLLAIVETVEVVQSFKPPLEAIARLPERGLLLSAADSSGMYDYVYRAFFPKLGIPEDPVTGSANTSLAPYWSRILTKRVMMARQLSLRGGLLRLEVIGNRLLISGKALTAFSAELVV